jgi:plasmid stabilization system protein ParE
MPVQVVYRLAAGRDVGEARAWYEAARPGRGLRFQLAVEAPERLIADHHDAFPVVGGPVRRELVARFPYALYYQPLDADTVEVIACLHTRRRPGAWRGRRDA